MSLKSLEIKKNYSWVITAILKSHFCSFSCCQACFPTLIRQIRSLWNLNLEVFFNSPEMNCSILFSMYLLRMTKKMNYFPRNFVRRVRMFPWVNINPIPVVHRNGSRWRVNKFLFLWFRFCLWSACKIFRIRNLYVVVRIHQKFLIHEKI